MSKQTPKLENNALSLSCDGAVPTLLRAIADHIDQNSATPEQVVTVVVTVVTRDVLKLEVTLHLRGKQ